MKNLAIFWISMFLTILVVPVLVDAATYPHTIVKPNMAGMSVSIPVDANVWNCVYVTVTDCREPDPAPIAVNDIPTPRGAAGWTFGVLMPRDGWSVEVSSEHATEDRVGMLDGDPLTIWRSGSAGHPETGIFPHWVIIDMKREGWVDGLIYTPRPYDPDVTYCQNGTIEKYEVWVGNNYVPAHLDDDENPVAANGAWVRVANGTLTYETPNQTQRIDFLIPNKARWVKLVALSGIKGTNIAAAAEIYITESVRDTVEITGGAVQ
jgi:hypothetical protein